MSLLTTEDYQAIAAADDRPRRRVFRHRKTRRGNPPHHPPRVFNVVPGTGPDVGEPIGRHMDIDAVSFTGSTETGRRFLRCAAESNLKEVTPEMGVKIPAVVLDDAENLHRRHGPRPPARTGAGG